MGGRVNPARAGMIRRRTPVRIRYRGRPCASGDDTLTFWLWRGVLCISVREEVHRRLLTLREVIHEVYRRIRRSPAARE